MLTRSLPAFGILALSIAPLPAAAQLGPNTASTAPQISPLRLEFTRPGGTPGSPRYIAPSQSTYMLAPAQPTETATPKKKKSR
jgi:hypothetical protein